MATDQQDSSISMNPPDYQILKASLDMLLLFICVLTLYLMATICFDPKDNKDKPKSEGNQFEPRVVVMTHHGP